VSGHSALILLITLLVMTTGGVLIFYQFAGETQQVPLAMRRQSDDIGDLVLVNVVGSNIVDNSYKHVQIQVRYEGDEPLALNDTFIQLSTQTSSADLAYREGEPVRDEETGFYTQ
jgi:hypothetical protein